MKGIVDQSPVKGLWFDGLITALRSHELQLETGTANPEMEDIYRVLFEGNADEIARLTKNAAQKYFVPRIIVDYLQEVKHFPSKLAFDFNDSEVLVWVEIEGDYADTEKRLLKAEAKINAKYHQYGFDMESTIVESEDKLSIPSHYAIFKA